MRLSWPKRWQKKTHLSRELLLYSPKDFFISLLLYAASVFVCLILRHFDTSKATSYVAMIFLLDVFLTAFFTDGFLFSLLDAVLGVLSVDYQLHALGRSGDVSRHDDDQHPHRHPHQPRQAA